jgi:hypothetical protein
VRQSACLRAQGPSHTVPLAQEREGSGQVQDDAANGDDDMSSELYQSLAKSGHLCSGTGGSLRSESQFLHEHVGGRCHQDPELVGPELGAARAVDLQPVVELFDPVLDVSPVTVGRIHSLCGASQVGNDVPGVVSGRSTFELDHLGLDHDTALVGPMLPRSVPAVSEEMRGPARLAGPLPSFSHQLRRTPLQNGVFGDRDDVVKPLLLVEEVQDFRTSEASVQADEKPRAGKSIAQAIEDPSQDADGSEPCRCIARTEYRGEEMLFRLVVEGQEPQDGQVAPRVVVAIEQGQLLIAVGRVVGRIQVDGDASGFAAEPLAMSLDDEIGKCGPESIQGQGTDRVLEAAERRLRSQGIALDGIPAKQQLVDRVVRQAGCIVGIGITAGEAKDPLGDEIAKLVGNLPRLPVIAEACRERGCQPQAIVSSLQEHCAPVGAAVLLVEGDDDGLGSELREQQTGCRGMLGHAKASAVLKRSVATAFYHEEAFVLADFVNYPG